MCGDSTNVQHVEKLMAGKKAALLHADPPYGMGKQADGVANDNLYEQKLDEFQLEWWATFRTFIDDNASAYIWGNSPDLWRLWWQAGLGTSEKLEMRNQIVWDKKSIAGMASSRSPIPRRLGALPVLPTGQPVPGQRQQRRLPRELGAVAGLHGNRGQSGRLSRTRSRELCGVQMFSHWFTRAQFTLIPEKHYATLQGAYPGRFQRPAKSMKAEWDKVKGGPTTVKYKARAALQ